MEKKKRSLLKHTARRMLGRNTMREFEASMNQVQVEQKSYQMPPQDGFTVAYFPLSPTSNDRLYFTKQSSGAAF
jgi:hypothetical protein